MAISRSATIPCLFALSWAATGAAQECRVDDPSCETDADDVVLLQKSLLKQGRSLSFENLDHEALNAALDAFESFQAAQKLEDEEASLLGREEASWFGSKFHCKYEKKAGCPQMSCGDMMVNTTCGNDVLGTGRPTCGACRADQLDYSLNRVNTDDIATEMSYAGPGSSIPEDLHGLWWMDQYGYSVGSNLFACDPSFEYFFPTPANEIVLSWGDTAVYNQETGCIEWKIYYGGELGSWSWLDSSGRGTNPFWSAAYDAGTVMTFCEVPKEPATTYKIDIKIRFRGMDLLIPIFKLLGFYRVEDGYWQIGDLLGVFTMVKTCWGWDRVTTSSAPKEVRQLPSRVRSFITSYLPFLEPLVNGDHKKRVMHYPVFNVVTGEGQKNEQNWDVFYDWASQGSVERGVNKGGATILLGRPKSR